MTRKLSNRFGLAKGPSYTCVFLTVRLKSKARSEKFNFPNSSRLATQINSWNCRNKNKLRTIYGQIIFIIWPKKKNVVENRHRKMIIRSNIHCTVNLVLHSLWFFFRYHKLFCSTICNSKILIIILNKEVIPTLAFSSIF